MDQATVINITADLYSTTLVATALNGVWIYDWFLTLGDEINYAWGGRKYWTFWLFLANRYLPGLQVIWVNMVMFGNINNWFVSCRYTGWLEVVYTGLFTFTTQMTIAMRVYAVTGQDKLLCSPLFLLIIAQAVAAAITTVIYLRLPNEPLPEAILDLFRLCAHKLWKPGSLSYTTISLTFDSSAFLILLVRARRNLPPRFSGITSLLRVILRDGTLYFMVIFSIQFCSLLVLFVTTQTIQVLPAGANAIIVPIMASRLVLSLKTAAAEPTRSLSFRLTATESGTGNVTELAPVP